MNSRQRRKRMHAMEMARRKARKAEQRYLQLLKHGWLSIGAMEGELITGLDLADGKDYTVRFHMEPLLKHEG